MLIEILHAWLASWVYLYLAALSHSSLVLRCVFGACFLIYALLHLSFLMLLLAFVLHPVCWPILRSLFPLR